MAEISDFVLSLNEISIWLIFQLGHFCFIPGYHGPWLSEYFSRQPAFSVLIFKHENAFLVIIGKSSDKLYRYMFCQCTAFLSRREESKTPTIPSISDSQTMKKNPFKVICYFSLIIYFIFLNINGFLQNVM